MANSVALDATVPAARTIARASGCSDGLSTAAAICRRRSVSPASGPVARARRPTRACCPRVRVPVLSQTTARSFPAASRMAASRTRIPASAPRPVPAITAVGVARPMAQGQATTSTAMAVATARTRRGSAPSRYQPTKVATAISRITGTNTSEMRSARRAMAGFEPCARSTMATMRASVVFAPTCVARITIAASVRSVPVASRLPGPRSTGSDSPVIADSSTAARPLTMMPSTGMRPPGRMRNRSPAMILLTAMVVAVGASAVASSSASFGCRASIPRTALVVCSFARASIQRPSATKPRMSAAASHVACAGTPTRMSSLWKRVIATDQPHAAVVPRLTSVSMVSEPCRSARSAREWKRQPTAN